jgi:hypothetical protein
MSPGRFGFDYAPLFGTLRHSKNPEPASAKLPRRRPILRV